MPAAWDTRDRLDSARVQAEDFRKAAPQWTSPADPSNWIGDHGTGEFAMEKLARQVGTSVANLRKTYVHIALSDDDWDDIRSFGRP